MDQSYTLFSPLNLAGLNLKNRITMAPMFVSYANGDGTASPLLRYTHEIKRFFLSLNSRADV